MNARKLMEWLWGPPVSAPRATILIRSMAGGVFLWEGILKFVYVNQGVGRFTKLGFPFPELTAHFVGVLEIVGGILLIAGLLPASRRLPSRSRWWWRCSPPRSPSTSGRRRCRCPLCRRRSVSGRCCTRSGRSTPSS